MLKLQEFLNCFDAVEEAALYLKRNLNITVNICELEDDLEAYGPFTVFKPGQKADMSNPLVREAHCLIVDEHRELLAKAWDHPRIVKDASSGFPPEFSFGLGTVGEELPDGEIVVIYNVEGEWVIGTQDHPTGANYITANYVGNLCGFTYNNEVKSLLRIRYPSGWDTPFKNVNPMMCFIFNYVSPYMGGIMPILSPELYLMGVINLENEHDLSCAVVDGLANKMDFARPNWTEINGMTSLVHRLGRMRTLSPGIMLKDKQSHRVIIPNPIYTAVKNAKISGDRIRPTHMAKILQTCRDKADVMAICAAYEGYGPMLELMWSVREELWEELMMLWDSAHKKKAMKDFAEMVHHHPLNYLLFMYRDKRIDNLKEEVAKIKPIKLVSIARKKWAKEFDHASRLLKFSGGTNGNDKEDVEKEGSIPWSQDGD